MPRERIRAPGHDRERSLGYLALRWIEHFCVHGPGDVEGVGLGELPLDDEFAGFIVDCYALGPKGRRLYDSAFLSRAKGRAKSELAGLLALFEALGPCRFERFAEGGEIFRHHDFVHEYLPGEPMGRLVTYPFIRCLATEESQSGNTYDNVYFNLTEGPLSEGLPRDAAGLTRTLLPGGGEIRPSTASNAAKDGGKETFVVFDETHLYILAELVRMYATVRRNEAKRKQAEPWSLETSTMYLPGEDSVAEATHDLAKEIRAGNVKRARLLFDHRQADPDLDLTDEAQVRAGLADAYGDFFEQMDVERLLSEIWDPRNAPEESRRYFFNVPSSAADAWITEFEWAARLDIDRTVHDRDMITLGFDGSRKRARGVTDATALIGCRVADGHVFEIATWEQPSGPAGKDWQVPTTEVEAAVAGAFARYRVVGFFADPAKWETFVSGWEAKYGGQLKVRATRDHPVQWWMTGGRAIQTVRALEQFQSAVLDGGMSHDGAHTLTKHVLNARRRPSRSGMQIAKEHPESARKIDAAVAAVLAYLARLEAVAKGLGRQRTVAKPIR